MLDPDRIRADFPILGHPSSPPLVYLDSAASAQKPRQVIEAVQRGYAEEYANVHRGLYRLSQVATERYEQARTVVARFLNAAHDDEIIFTSGTTQGINLVAASWAGPRLNPGDEILLSVMEHHANIVPWHFLRERSGVRLRWVECGADGCLDPQAVIDAIGPATRLIAITQMSNVTGARVDVGAICRAAQRRGVPVLIDGSQGAAHEAVDVQALGCDFYAVTGHKLGGPSGSGALYIRRERAAGMRPFLGGGDMIRKVTRDTVTYADPPLRFEAGTPAFVSQVGFGAALDYLQTLGRDEIARTEAELARHALTELSAIPGLRLFHPAGAGPIFSFTADDSSAPTPQRLARRLAERGIAVRAGTFCAQPFIQHLGVPALCRASLSFINTREDIDALAGALAEFLADD